MLLEYEMLGLNLREHPMALYRDELDSRGILGSAALRAMRGWRAGPLRRAWWSSISRRRRRTASISSPGRRRWADRRDRLSQTSMRGIAVSCAASALLLVEGVIQQQYGVTNLLAARVEPLNRDVLKRYPRVARKPEGIRIPQ